MKRYLYIIVIALMSTITQQVQAQHTFAAYGGTGVGGERIFPAVFGRSVTGLGNYGLSWRTYSGETFVGCFGVDVEFIQQGFSFSPNASAPEDIDYYYTRKINSIMVPIVWQPHVYLFERRVRLFLDAAATFSYNLSSTYDNDYLRQETGASADEYEGKYTFQTVRDNRFGYGIAFGPGIAFLSGQLEFFARVRYYLGLSDIVKNRNKYYENTYQDPENPFSLSPIRSSLTNINLTFGVAYRIGKEGFKSWSKKKDPKLNIGTDFNYQTTPVSF